MLYEVITNDRPELPQAGVHERAFDHRLVRQPVVPDQQTYNQIGSSGDAHSSVYGSHLATAQNSQPVSYNFV